MNYTPEQLTKAKSAKSADELLALAKESGIEMTADEAAKYFAELHKEGELTDSELASVAGGKGEPDPKFQKGDRVKLSVSGSTAKGIDHPETYGTITQVNNYVNGQWHYYIVFDDNPGIEYDWGENTLTFAN